MKESFQPRKVSKDAWLTWCSEAISLSIRNPIRNTIIAIMFCLPFFVLPGADNTLKFALFLLYCLVCPPVLFSVMVVASYCSDYGESTLPRLLTMAHLLGMLKTSAFYGLIILLTLLLGTLIYITLLPLNISYSSSQVSDGQVVSALKPAFLSFQSGEKLWWSLFAYLFFGAVTWFFAPLMCIAQCPFFIGVKLAYQTLIKNPFMFWLPLVMIIAITPLCWFSGIFAIPAAVLIGMLIYTSFRDVFMGRRQSYPVRSRHQATAPATQH